MEIEIVEKQEQPLLKRTKIKYRVTHPKESTPNRNTIKDELAKVLKAKKGTIVIDHQESQFGKSETIGVAKVYEKPEIVKEVERDYILKRNKLMDPGEKMKEEKKKPEEKPAEKAEKPKKEEKEPKPEPEPEKAEAKPEDKGE
jgi:small subunit ribosomal protein S24e